MSDSAQIAGGMYVALAAPRGVGKTSVLTALLAEANEVLAGTRVSVEATGQTRLRFNKLDNALRGHLRARQFVPEGIGGTQEAAQFSLEIRAAGTDRRFSIEILDYPGGLLDSREGEDWRRVSQWFRSADVLILPVDATLLMEAATSRQHQRAEELLNVAEMESIAAREWAKQRQAAGLGAGLLVVCPVKGETYFADNGGTTDRAEDLWRQVRSVYGRVVDAARKESSQIRVLYCPIDTIGCVEIMRVEWPAANAPEASPVAHYRVRGDAQLRRKGAADLFVALIGRMLGDVHDQQSRDAEVAAEEARLARQRAEANRGLFGNFAWWINGERKKARKRAEGKEREAAAEAAALEELQKTLEDVRSRPLSARVRAWMA